MKRHERKLVDDKVLPADGKKPALSGRCLPRGVERGRQASARLPAATAHDFASTLQLSARLEDFGRHAYPPDSRTMNLLFRRS